MEIYLDIKSFEGDHASKIEIDISTSTISEEEFTMLIKSKKESNWKTVRINVFISTREDIELGSSFAKNPILFQDDTFPVKYEPTIDFKKEGTKIKAFISSIDLVSTGESVGVQLEREDQIDNSLIFYFSSFKNTSVRFLKISIIIFQSNSPGLLYSQGFIEQNFLTTIVEVDIPEHGINNLRSYIVGPISFQLLTEEQASFTADFSDEFRLVFGSESKNEIRYLAVNYLIFSVIECGSCTHFPFPYDGVC